MTPAADVRADPKFQTAVADKLYSDMRAKQGGEVSKGDLFKIESVTLDKNDKVVTTESITIGGKTYTVDSDSVLATRFEAKQKAEIAAPKIQAVAEIATRVAENKGEMSVDALSQEQRTFLQRSSGMDLNGGILVRDGMGLKIEFKGDAGKTAVRTSDLWLKQDLATEGFKYSVRLTDEGKIKENSQEVSGDANNSDRRSFIQQGESAGVFRSGTTTATDTQVKVTVSYDSNGRVEVSRTIDVAGTSLSKAMQDVVLGGKTAAINGDRVSLSIVPQEGGATNASGAVRFRPDTVVLADRGQGALPRTMGAESRLLLGSDGLLKTLGLRISAPSRFEVIQGADRSLSLELTVLPLALKEGSPFAREAAGGLTLMSAREIGRALDQKGMVKALANSGIFSDRSRGSAIWKLYSALERSGLGQLADAIKSRGDALTERTRLADPTKTRTRDNRIDKLNEAKSLTTTEKRDLKYLEAISTAIKEGTPLDSWKMRGLQAAYLLATAKEQLANLKVSGSEPFKLREQIKGEIKALSKSSVRYFGKLDPEVAREQGNAYGSRVYNVEMMKEGLNTYQQALSLVKTLVGTGPVGSGVKNSEVRTVAMEFARKASPVQAIKERIEGIKAEIEQAQVELGSPVRIQHQRVTAYDLVRGMESMTAKDIASEIASLSLKIREPDNNYDAKNLKFNTFKHGFLVEVQGKSSGMSVPQAVRDVFRKLQSEAQPLIAEIGKNNKVENRVLESKDGSLVAKFARAFNDLLIRYEGARRTSPSDAIKDLSIGRVGDRGAKYNQTEEVLKFLMGDSALKIGTGGGKTDVIFEVAALATVTLFGTRWNGFVQVIPESLMKSQFGSDKAARFEHLGKEFGVKMAILHEIAPGATPADVKKIIDGAQVVVLSPAVLESLQRQATSQRNNTYRGEWVKIRDNLLKNSVLNIDEIHLTPDTAALIEGSNTKNLQNTKGEAFVQEGKQIYDALLTVVERHLFIEPSAKLKMELEGAKTTVTEKWLTDKSRDGALIKDLTGNVNIEATAKRFMAAQHTADYLKPSERDGVVFKESSFRNEVLTEFAQRAKKGSDFVDKAKALDKDTHSALTKLDAIITVAAKKDNVAGSYGLHNDQKAVEQELQTAQGEGQTFKKYVEGSRYGQLGIELKEKGVNLNTVDINRVSIEKLEDGRVAFTVKVTGSKSVVVHVDAWRAVPKSEVRLETDRLFSQIEEALAYEIVSKATEGRTIRAENVYYSGGSTMTTFGEVINFVSKNGGRVAGWTGTLAAMSRTLELVYGVKTGSIQTGQPDKFNSVKVLENDLKMSDLEKSMGAERTMLFVETAKLSPKYIESMAMTAASKMSLDHVIVRGESGKEYLVYNRTDKGWVKDQRTLSEEQASKWAEKSVSMEGADGKVEKVDFSEKKVLFISDQVTGFDPTVRKSNVERMVKFVLLTDRDVTSDRLEQGVGRNRNTNDVDVLVLDRSDRHRSKLMSGTENDLHVKQFWTEAVDNATRYSQAATYREIN
ncbi:MAG: hypothetical protein IPN90_04260 [Elusimicrobia bacterium]|nr:hypothetical protein [Elusimicrobiota bacterium]